METRNCIKCDTKLEGKLVPNLVPGVNLSYKFCPKCGEDNNPSLEIKKYSRWYFELLALAQIIIFLVAIQLIFHMELMVKTGLILYAVIFAINRALIKKCPNCHAWCHKDHEYCHNCGVKLKNNDNK